MTHSNRRTFLARLAGAVAAIVAAPDMIKAMGLTAATPLAPDYQYEHSAEVTAGPYLDIRKVADDQSITLVFDSNVPVEVSVDGEPFGVAQNGEVMYVPRPKFGERARCVSARATKDGQTVVHQSSVPARSLSASGYRLVTQNGEWVDPSVWEHSNG